MGYLKKLYKDKYLNKIFLSPDNGFFQDTNLKLKITLLKLEKIIFY